MKCGDLAPVSISEPASACDRSRINPALQRPANMECGDPAPLPISEPASVQGGEEGG